MRWTYVVFLTRALGSSASSEVRTKSTAQLEREVISSQTPIPKPKNSMSRTLFSLGLEHEVILSLFLPLFCRESHRNLKEGASAPFVDVASEETPSGVPSKGPA